MPPDIDQSLVDVSASGTKAARADGLTAIAPMLLLVLIVGGVLAAQGGYFPTSWGWPSLALLWALGLWFVLSGRGDADHADAVFLALLTVFAAWVGVSIAWSTNPAQTVLELERSILLVAGTAAFLVFLHRELVGRTGLVIVVVITLASSYGLGTRLFPDRLGVFDPIAEYRLAEPIGYWNGLGILAVMGILLAFGIAVSESGWASRATSGLALVILIVTLYFTYSRASWAVLGIGLAVATAISTRRLFMVIAALALAPLPAIGVVLASSSDALTRRGARLVDAVADGRRLALLVVILAVLEIGVVAMLPAMSRVRLALPVRRALGAALALALVVVLVRVVVHFGGPIDTARAAYDSFNTTSSEEITDLDKRLFRLSGGGRPELWRFAWSIYRDNPLLGSGAGSFERGWESNPNAPFKVRDAHGLFIETLAELGPVGLLVLIAALAIPLVAAIPARTQQLVPACLGAYVAFLVHAAQDWDWELSGVTLVALLVAALLLASRRRGPQSTLGDRVRIAGAVSVVLVSVFAVVGVLGNSALARSEDARAASRLDKAEQEAERARSFMPWSPSPWIAQGEAQLERGALVEARASFRRALEIDDREWKAWLELAVASPGKTRARALARARLLYPTSVEITRVEQELAEGSG